MPRSQAYSCHAKKAINRLQINQPRTPLKFPLLFFGRAFRPENKNAYRGYFPVVPGKISHKNGIDLTMEDFVAKESMQGLPFVEKTPKLVLPEKEEEVKEFYRVRFISK